MAPDTRYVTHPAPDGPTTIAVILSNDGYLTCTHEWNEHAQSSYDPLTWHQGRLPCDLPPEYVATRRAILQVIHKGRGLAPVLAPDELPEPLQGEWPPLFDRTTRSSRPSSIGSRAIRVAPPDRLRHDVHAKETTVGDDDLDAEFRALERADMAGRLVRHLLRTRAGRRLAARGM